MAMENLYQSRKSGKVINSSLIIIKGDFSNSALNGYGIEEY